jgi:hypothetical protein
MADLAAPADDSPPADATGLRFIPPAYPGGRILLRCGGVDVGAVFQSWAVPSNGCHWRVWFTPDAGARNGWAKSELAAKNAALAVFREFLAAAGLEVKGA